jgi:hypothetical protein
MLNKYRLHAKAEFIQPALKNIYQNTRDQTNARDHL